MKTLQALLFLFLPFFAWAQSPQCVNFTNTTYLGNGITTQGNNIWFTVSGALVKMDKTTGGQTIYKPDNSDMVGMGANTLGISPDGLLWGGGLYGFWKFDGTHFTNYATTTNGDSITNVFDIEWDALGNMYLSVKLGEYNTDIIKYNGTTIEKLNSPAQTISNYNMCVTDSGKIYFASSSTGNNYSYYNGSVWTVAVLPPNTGHDFVKNSNQEIIALPLIFSPSSTNIYKLVGTTWIPILCNWANAPASDIQASRAMIGSNDDIYIIGLTQSNIAAQIIKISDTTMSFTGYPPPANAINYYFNSIAQDSSGDIWMNLRKTYPNQGWAPQIDLVKYSNNSFTATPYKPDIEMGIRFQLDKFNQKWARTPNGFSLFNGLSWQKISLPFGETGSWNGSPFDKEGNIWTVLTNTSTIAQDVYKYDGAWHSIHATNAANCIAVNDMDKICIGLTGGAIDYFNGTNWQISYFGQLNGDIKSMCVDANNVFWMVTDYGQIATFDGTNLVLKPYTVPFLSYNTRTSFDKMGRLWITDVENNTVNIINGTSVTTYSNGTIPNLGTAKIMGGCVDLNGNIWLGTNQGLFKKNGNTWINYNVNNSHIASNTCLDLFVDIANNIWFSSYSAISVFNESGIALNTLQTSYNASGGNVYHDINGNGHKDTLEYPLASQKVYIQPDNINRYSQIDGTYSYASPLSSGNPNFTIMPYPNWQLTSDSTLYHVQSGLSRDSLDFGLQATTTIDSISVVLYAERHRCSTQVPYWISYQNKGTTTLSGSVVLTIDSLTSNLISFPPATSSTAFTYTWNFQNLLPFESRGIDLSLLMPNFSFMGVPIKATLSVSTANSTAFLQHTDSLGCSHDPNDKTAFLPNGSFQGNEVLKNTEFTYLIRFQNTGNDVAFNVMIHDTLVAYWDMSTFEVLESSHPMLADYSPNGIVRFQFPNIMLPDSGTNEPASHGFVAYKVKPISTIPDYTVLENTAFIYFDSNPAVVTNTTSHTIVSNFTGISEGEIAENIKWYPNPMHDFGTISYDNPENETYIFTLWDISGKKVFQTTNNQDKITFNGKDWSPGLYIFSLTNGKKTMRGKWLKRE